MSLIPILYNYDPWYNRPSLWDWDRSGFGVSPWDIYSLVDNISRLCVGRHIAGDLQPCTIGKDGFQACIDVKQFKPNEITVKTVDNTVLVEGKHEERPDEHGYISREFVRKYALPEGYDPNAVVSTLSSDGILTIKAPRPKEAIEAGIERNVQIQQTGPAHLNVKENPKEEPKEELKEEPKEETK